MPYEMLLSLGFNLGKALVAHFTKAELPQELIDAAKNLVDAIDKHAKDRMTLEDWEALRG